MATRVDKMSELLREDGGISNELTPVWDPDFRELRYDGILVKRLSAVAANQAKILAAFQEEGWPQRIFDPLSPSGTQPPARRLRRAIYQLNKAVNAPLLHFHTNGDGISVCWRFRTEDGS